MSNARIEVTSTKGVCSAQYKDDAREFYLYISGDDFRQVERKVTQFLLQLRQAKIVNLTKSAQLDLTPRVVQETMDELPQEDMEFLTSELQDEMEAALKANSQLEMIESKRLQAANDAPPAIASQDSENIPVVTVKPKKKRSKKNEGSIDNV